MKAIIGLGNPGRQYVNTRHNVGFRAIDSIAERACCSVSKGRFGGLYGDFAFLGQTVALLKPQTFMNLSGESVAALMRYYAHDLTMSDVLVIYDDVALPLATIRAREQGSAGGHNGLKSIIEICDTLLIPRLRIGVGSSDKIRDLSQFVLGQFSADERQQVDSCLERVYDACLCWIEYGMSKTMSVFNNNE